jgi:tRNA G46 methylase TrmB
VIDDPSVVLSQDQIDVVSDLVRRRAAARWEGNYEQADVVRKELLQFPGLEDDGYSIVMQDVPRNQGGGSTWQLVQNVTISGLEGTTVLQLAHAALGLAIASSEQGVAVDTHQLNLLMDATKYRLAQTPAVYMELGGRKAADAAFWFALAGVTSDEILQALASIAATELHRFGTRDSCRAKDVWQIIDRFTAAGVRDHEGLQQAAEAALLAKAQPTSNVALEFHSDRCLLMIWKFSTRQRKQRVFLEMARNHWLRENKENQSLEPVVDKRSASKVAVDWNQIYRDPTKPLVIDIGCGMGVSLLGLAQEEQGEGIVNWSECNFAGVDLSGLAINYGQSLGTSWKLDDRLHFFFDSAESFVEQVSSTYPGPVELCMVQFPTPYRLSSSSPPPMASSTTVATNDDIEASATTTNDEDSRGGGNSQLPSSATEGFMVSEKLLQLVHKTLAPHAGKLLVQSNCEDVAVWMRNTAIQDCHFADIEAATQLLPSTTDDSSVAKPTSPTKRTVDWMAMTGGDDRAEGAGWSAGPILPRHGRTETEVACMLNGTPVHRCLLQATSR